MPVVPWAHARTARGFAVAAVGATTVAETATGWSSAVRDQCKTCHASAPSTATGTGRDRMISPGAPAGVSPGSKKGSPVYSARGGAVAGGPAAAVGEDDGGSVADPVGVVPPLAGEPASEAGDALACAGGTRLADPLEDAFPPHAASSAIVTTSGPDRSRRSPR